MKKKYTGLKIIIIILAVFQSLAYLGGSKSHAPEVSGAEAAGYYVGYNLTGIFAVILFLIYLSKRKQAKKDDTQAMIDSIGKE